MLLLLPGLATLVLYAATLSSGVRQRTAVEPLALILIATAIVAYGWRWTARAGAIVLGVIAIAAPVDLGEPLAALPILAGAGALWAVSRRLPEASADSRTAIGA
jgi:hypothetical protein